MAEGEAKASAGAADLLQELLALARREGALQGEALALFAEALRDRARAILGERAGRAEELRRENEWRRETAEALEREATWLRGTVAGLEERAAGLERESEWRRETVETLTRESAWLRETVAGLEARAESLACENEWRRDTAATLAGRLAGEHAEAQAARQAHEQLLAHHQEVLRAVQSELASIVDLPFYRQREGRRRLAALAALLRKESQ
jgi:hypothetical protein